MEGAGGVTTATQDLANQQDLKNAAAIDNQAFATLANDVLLDLGASNEQILSVINASMDNPGQMALVQRLMAMREQAQAMLSTLIKTLKDIGMTIIGNMK
jgi:hypothetical protein